MGLQSFRGGVYNIVKIQSLYLFFLFVQLEKERKAREEREKRDAEEAAERQRREEEWVRVITVVEGFFVFSFKTGTFTCTSLSVK